MLTMRFRIGMPFKKSLENHSYKKPSFISKPSNKTKSIDSRLFVTAEEITLNYK